MEKGTPGKKSPSPKIGRNWSDLASEVLDRLGSLAPWVIILVIVGYGVLQFQTLSQKNFENLSNAATEVREQARKDLETANQALNETYMQIVKLNRDQLSNLTDSFELQKKLSAELKTYESNLKEATADAQRAKDEAVKARQQTAEEIERKRQAEEDTRRLQKELDQRAKDIARRGDELTKRAGRIEDLREALKEFAETVKRETDPSSFVHKEAMDVVATYLIDPETTLRSLAKNPSQATIQEMNELVGVHLEKILSVINTEDRGGFDAWFLAKEDDSKFVFGTLQQTDLQYEAIAILESRDERIIEVNVARDMFATTLPTKDNWYRKVVVTVMMDSDGELDSTEFPAVKEGGMWSIEDLLHEEGVTTIDLISGQRKELRFLPADQFTSRLTSYPDGRKLIADEYYSPGLNLAMLRRAQVFEEKVLKEIDLDRISSPLRGILEKLLIDAVKHNVGGAQAFLGAALGPAVLGQIAAAALKPGFRIIGVSEVSDRSTTQMQQGGPSGALTLEVIAEYKDSPSDRKEVRFLFRKLGDSDDWILTDFGHAGPRALQLR